MDDYQLKCPAECLKCGAPAIVDVKHPNPNGEFRCGGCKSACMLISVREWI